VTPLWRDDVALVDDGADDVPRLPTGPAFSERDAPEAPVSLKRHPKKAAR
jgi:hypothetical protein